MVVGLPWEVLSGVHVDACCEGRVWQTNVVDKYGCGGSFGRMGGNELVEGARDSCEAVLFNGICHGCCKKWWMLVVVSLVVWCLVDAKEKHSRVFRCYNGALKASLISHVIYSALSLPTLAEMKASAA